MGKTETSIEIAGYQLPIVIEQVSGAYQVTNPALEGFLVLADTLDEALALAPGVALALLEAMQAKGVTPPLPIEDVISKAIHDYIQRKVSRDEFRTSLKQAMQENAQMIAELSER